VFRLKEAAAGLQQSTGSLDRSVVPLTGGYRHLPGAPDPPHFARRTSYLSSRWPYRGVSGGCVPNTHLNSTKRCLGPKYLYFVSTRIMEPSYSSVRIEDLTRRGRACYIV